MGGRAERRVKHAQTHEQGTPLAISEFFSSYDNYVFPPLHLNKFTETYKSNKIIINRRTLMTVLCENQNELLGYFSDEPCYSQGVL